MPEYIKREDVQNMLDNAQIITDAEGEYFGYCTEEVDINSIPAADVRENVRGKWLTYLGDEIQLDSKGRSQYECYCSVCGDFLSASDEYSCRGYYCPNCGAMMNGGGADMRGESDE